MKPSIFISYSHREVGFVDDLTHRLEAQGFNVWLDYRNLVPGTPWADQIAKGVDQADVILLVVSKESIASKFVEVEWRRVVQEEHKRIILVIFEAVDLPKELERYEWVDFRGSYEAGLKELIGQLGQPVREDHPPPETGFKIPRTVWVAFALSLVVALFSLGAFWTVFLPWLLVPLPYRILKREFNFTMVQAALLHLPFALLVTAFIWTNENGAIALFLLGFASLIFTIPLIVVLRSPAMQRWGKPEATMPRFADLYRPDIAHPEPVAFLVDFAPPDRPVADELTRVLEKYGHPQARDIPSAQVVFVLASYFKNSTQADPQKQALIPVILQTVEVPPEISKVQWIDFRGGVRNLNAIAQLLPQPDRLLQALGVRPMGNSFLLPSVILYLVYSIAVVAVATFGLWLPVFYQFSGEILSKRGLGGLLAALAASLAIFGLLCYFMLRGVVHRRGRFASTRMVIATFIALGVIVFVQLLVGASFVAAAGGWADPNDKRGFSSLIPSLIYLVAALVVAVSMLIWRRDVRLWFPARVKR